MSQKLLFDGDFILRTVRPEKLSVAILSLLKLLLYEDVSNEYSVENDYSVEGEE